MESYAKGTLVRARGCFTNRKLTVAEKATFLLDGTLPVGVGVDPSIVKFDYVRPGDVVKTDTYPTNVAKQETGSYYRYLDADIDDEWKYRFYSTGTGQASRYRRFMVESDF